MYEYSRKLGKESNYLFWLFCNLPLTGPSLTQFWSGRYYLPTSFAAIRRYLPLSLPLSLPLFAAICRYQCRYSPLFAVIIAAIRRYLPVSLPLFAVILAAIRRYLPLSSPLFAANCRYLPLIAANCRYPPLWWYDLGSPGRLSNDHPGRCYLAMSKRPLVLKNIRPFHVFEVCARHLLPCSLQSDHLTNSTRFLTVSWPHLNDCLKVCPRWSGLFWIELY